MSCVAQDRHDSEPQQYPSAPSASAPSVPRSTPNVLIITVDDMGSADTLNLPTPAIDSIMATKCNHHYTYPVCSSSRCMMLTGDHPWRNGLRANPELFTEGINGDAPTLARLMENTHPNRALIGKWHLGYAAERHPLNMGFTHQYGFLGGSVHPFNHTDSTPDQKIHHDWSRNGVELWQTGNMHMDLIANEANWFIDSAYASGQPWYCHVALPLPHVPFVEGWTYDEHILKIEESVAQILTSVDFGDTFIIFASDHGAHVTTGSNYPLEGGKGDYDEGGIRTFMGYWHPYEDHPPEIDHVTSNLDIWPTIEALLPLPDYAQLDPGTPSKPGLPLWSPAPREILFYEERSYRVMHGCVIANGLKYYLVQRQMPKTDPELVFIEWLRDINDNPVSNSNAMDVMRAKLYAQTPMTPPFGGA